jgi:gluconokinase
VSAPPRAASTLLRAVVVMGVSGCGKTAVGQALADRLGWTFFDGDDFHGPENRRKMAAGTPLEDADRWPWLERLRALLDAPAPAGGGIVLACSALKQAYRDRLGVPRPDVALIHLEGPREVLEARLHARTGHYMPPSLLTSQLDTLERPHDALTLSVDSDLDTVVARALDALAIAPTRRIP